MLEHEQRKSAQVHGRQRGVQRADEVFVEPLRLLYLEAYSLDRLQLLVGQVDDEAHAEVVQPVNQSHLGECHGEVGRCLACRGCDCMRAGRGELEPAAPARAVRVSEGSRWRQ